MKTKILMTTKKQKNTVSLYPIFTSLLDDNVEYVYRGYFDDKITEGILSLAEINLNDQTDSLKIRKRVFFILVEGLQNITRHQEINSDVDKYNEGFLVLQKNNISFTISTGNLIKNNAIDDLKDKIEKINKLSKDELKAYYRDILDNDTFSRKGGAGLGLIEIARKSGNKIAYDFRKISDEHSYFYMQTIISLEPAQKELAKKYLKKIQTIHKLFIEKNIFLNVTGIFNHDKLVYIISILESNMSKQIVLKNKMFSIMIELMQNVAKYADEVEINNENGKHSIFLIADDEKQISLMSGNFVRTDKIEKLKKHLDLINKMTYKELNKFHFDTLYNYKTNKGNEFGLGLLDMRIKSKNRLDYNIEKVSNFYSFFSIKVNLEKETERNKKLEIEKTDISPEVVLDEKNGIFSFCGNCYPEDALAFFEPIGKWLDEYSQNPRLFNIFEFKFKILSTSSQKELIKIMNKIEKVAQNSTVIVKWYFQKNNDDALDFAIEFSKLFNLDFNLVEFENLDCDK